MNTGLKGDNPVLRALKGGPATSGPKTGFMRFNGEIREMQYILYRSNMYSLDGTRTLEKMIFEQFNIPRNNAKLRRFYLEDDPDLEKLQETEGKITAVCKGCNRTLKMSRAHKPTEPKSLPICRMDIWLRHKLTCQYLQNMLRREFSQTNSSNCTKNIGTIANYKIPDDDISQRLVVFRADKRLSDDLPHCRRSELSANRRGLRYKDLETEQRHIAERYRKQKSMNINTEKHDDINDSVYRSNPQRKPLFWPNTGLKTFGSFVRFW